ncbi:hypothetical protein BDQ94DRAFT_143025 [Aspergillus welwitschiae]|uniref:Uncharacterized protein n=1 Tax=Aspergillus welwitschiae TaxID=1341132 RepID=A0A3F3Q475_9EURO|nr:hypothetical protein BDQ94DRAFT_143025 [Aspergillus welwitschiae]RDH33978.1 hypothetical protein BDQ94DRAFT_143025 [Aspergillus welwitschiae]
MRSWPWPPPDITCERSKEQDNQEKRPILSFQGSPTPYAGPGGSDYRSLAYLGKDRTLSVDPSGNIFSAIRDRSQDRAAPRQWS